MVVPGWSSSLQYCFTSQNGELCIGRRNEGDPCISDENNDTRTMGETEILMIIELRNIPCDNSSRIF